MGCSRKLLGDCDETFLKRRHNRIKDREVLLKAVTTVTFFRFFESSDKSRLFAKRAGRVCSLRDTSSRKESSEIFIHSEALMWEISFIKDLENCRYEEISIAVSVEAVRREMHMLLALLWRCTFPTCRLLQREWILAEVVFFKPYPIRFSCDALQGRRDSPGLLCLLLSLQYRTENRWPICCWNKTITRSKVKMAFFVPNLGNRTDIALSRLRCTGVPVTTRDSVLMGRLHIVYTSREQMMFLTISIATVNMMTVDWWWQRCHRV